MECSLLLLEDAEKQGYKQAISVAKCIHVRKSHAAELAHARGCNRSADVGCGGYRGGSAGCNFKLLDGSKPSHRSPAIAI